MKKVFLLSGVQGSGKSTWASKQLEANPKSVIVSRDEVRFARLNADEDYFAHEAEVFRTFIQLAQDCITDNRYGNVYIDATHINDKSRKLVIEKLPQDIDLTIVIFDTPLKTCLERNSWRKGRHFVPPEVIKNTHAKLQLSSKLGKVEIVKCEHTHSTVWLSSDWHFGHDKPFVWQARGFDSVEEMNQAIVERHNSIVKPEDDVYVLGDLTLGDNTVGAEWIKQMNGKLHIIYGNHDTDRRIDIYKTLPNVVETGHGGRIKFKKCNFVLSHFPCLVGNFEDQTPYWNLSGHTHSENSFYDDIERCYHVGVDAHNNYPVSIDRIYEEIRKYREERKK